MLVENDKYSITVLDTGVYRAEISHSICPPVIEYFEIFNDDPGLTISQPEVVCNDNMFQLQATPTGGTWSGSSISSAGQFHGTGVIDGTYPVTYTYVTALGCSFQAGTSVLVDKLVAPTLTYQGKEVCQDQPITITAQPIDSKSTIRWYQLNNLSQELGTNNSVEVSEQGIYTARINKHTCEIEISSIEIVEKRDTLFVPNVITANDDSFNDYFQIKGKDMNDFSVSLFNRYGQLVFTSVNPDFKWEGGDVSAGVYYWRIMYTNCANTRKDFTGWLQILK
jgi:gliding motility-associated-like protein